MSPVSVILNTDYICIFCKSDYFSKAFLLEDQLFFVNLLKNFFLSPFLELTFETSPPKHSSGEDGAQSTISVSQGFS